MRQVFYRLLIGALCVAALVAIGGFVSGDFGRTDARLLGTTLALVVFGSTSLTGFSLLSREKAIVLGYAAIAASILGLLAWANLIWTDSGFDDEEAWKAACVFLVAAAAAADAALLVLQLRDDDPPSVRAVVTGTIAVVAVLAGTVTIALLQEVEDEAFYRFMGVIAVLWVLGTILIPVLRKASGSKETLTRER